LRSDTRRYNFRSKFKVIDLGLRLEDVRELGLESEPVGLGRELRHTLRRHGATREEADFLLEGQRVELNAMTSDQFVDFVERKLADAGIEKVVPPKDQLDEAYCVFARSERIRTIVEEAIAADAGVEIAVPDDLEAQVRDFLANNPEVPWEDGVRHAPENVTGGRDARGLRPRGGCKSWRNSKRNTIRECCGFKI
jgi:hypothetical protein